jgi:hypothetical protein
METASLVRGLIGASSNRGVIRWVTARVFILRVFPHLLYLQAEFSIPSLLALAAFLFFPKL